jgi:hypothetical protein
LPHVTVPDFWELYAALPEAIRALADKNYELLKTNPQHPSLHFKRVGQYWSVRVGRDYRALGVDSSAGIAWFWIGKHAVYNALIRS